MLNSQGHRNTVTLPAVAGTLTSGRSFSTGDTSSHCIPPRDIRSRGKGWQGIALLNRTIQMHDANGGGQLKRSHLHKCGTLKGHRQSEQKHQSDSTVSRAQAFQACDK